MSEHVLMVRPDNNGDVLLAGPAVRAVAASGARVTLWTGPRGHGGARLLPDVDDWMETELPWIDPQPAPTTAEWADGVVADLASRAIDRAIVLTSFHQSPLPTALLLRMAGVPFVGATSVDYPGSLLDVRHRIADDVHEVYRALDLVRTCGYELPPDDDGGLQVDTGGARNPVDHLAPYVVVHPGASVQARAWHAEGHAQAVHGLREDGWHVVLTGAADEHDLVEGIRPPDDPGATSLAGRCDWHEMAEVLRGADAVVVGNTGPAHLAAAVDTPVVSLFAPTVPAVRWRPWQVPMVLLGDQEVPCAGCRATTCPVAGHPCLGSVDPMEVRAAVRGLTEHEVVHA